MMNNADFENYIKNSLQESTESVFLSTAKLILEWISDDQMPIEEESIISSISFIGTLEGNFAICIPDRFARQVVSRMLGVDTIDNDADVADGIGEMVNLVSGGVKSKLVGTKHTLEISTPTVIKGNRMVILSNPGKTSRIALNYACGEIKFLVSMVFQISDKKDKNTPKVNKADALQTLNQINKLIKPGNGQN